MVVYFDILNNVVEPVKGVKYSISQEVFKSFEKVKDDNLVVDILNLSRSHNVVLYRVGDDKGYQLSHDDKYENLYIELSGVRYRISYFSLLPSNGIMLTHLITDTKLKRDPSHGFSLTSEKRITEWFYLLCRNTHS